MPTGQQAYELPFIINSIKVYCRQKLLILCFIFSLFELPRRKGRSPIDEEVAPSSEKMAMSTTILSTHSLHSPGHPSRGWGQRRDNPIALSIAGLSVRSLQSRHPSRTGSLHDDRGFSGPLLEEIELSSVHDLCNSLKQNESVTGPLELSSFIERKASLTL